MEVNYAVFPFIDNKNRITYVKKMHYINGKRDKKIYRVFKAYKGVFKQCLFGLHLVDTSKNVCVVESEKTALFCDIMYPEYTWVATGGEMMINKINVLEKATVFADKGKAFQYWSKKIDKSRFAMSDVMEKSDLPDGSDLADLIINEMKVN